MGQVYRVVSETMNRLGALPADSLDEILTADGLARQTANYYLQELS